MKETRGERVLKEGIRYAARGADFLLQTAPIYIPRFARRLREEVEKYKVECGIVAVMAGLVALDVLNSHPEVSRYALSVGFAVGLGILAYSTYRLARGQY